jgi:hypothetical protein
MKLRRLAVLTAALLSSAAHAATTTVVVKVPSPSGGGTPFAALKTYYMGPNGNDNNSGLDRQHEWLTPNHPLNCGDTIKARHAAYTVPQWGYSFGAVSNCPSKSGGIDGKGGIWAAILVCDAQGMGQSDGCYMTKQPGSPIFMVKQSYWTVQGFTMDGGANINGSTGSRGAELYACDAVVHHVSFVNDIVTNALQGYDTNDCGKAGGPNTYGGDYFAVVDSAAFNAASDQICLAAIDVVGPGVFDTKPGTHHYIAANWSYGHQNTTCRGKYDTEAYMVDTMGYHKAAVQVVLENNHGWMADRMGIQMFNQQPDTVATVIVRNNTLFKNNQNNGSDWLNGEININSTVKPNPWVITVANNIAVNPDPTPVNDAAFGLGTTITSFTHGGAGAENVYRSFSNTCRLNYCDNTKSAQSSGTSANLGTNIYVDPGFADTKDLLANWVKTPDCTGFPNVAKCFGYNADTRTMTPKTPFADLTPAVAYQAKGAQVPSVDCNVNPQFPDWMKGLVEIHVTANGDLVQDHSGATTPCGL